jgi:hypothetical protein
MQNSFIHIIIKFDCVAYEIQQKIGFSFMRLHEYLNTRFCFKSFKATLF